MELNPWTLGLQAINVLVLAWLLQRLFWRPVSGIIRQRRAETQSLLDDVAAKHEAVQAALADIDATRAGFAKERDDILKAAQQDAEDILKDARRKAEQEMEDLARQAAARIARAEKEAVENQVSQAKTVAVAIAKRLVEDLDTPSLQDAFVQRLIDKVEADSSDNSDLLADPTGPIELVSAIPLTSTEKAKVKKRLSARLGADRPIRFRTDPDLVAGFELHGDHHVIRNSWKADLETISRELQGGQ